MADRRAKVSVSTICPICNNLFYAGLYTLRTYRPKDMKQMGKRPFNRVAKCPYEGCVGELRADGEADVRISLRCAKANCRRFYIQRMIRQCEKGKIDMILTKSISRFARNTVDSLQYVRKLKAMGVAVVFEKEGIDTSTIGGVTEQDCTVERIDGDLTSLKALEGQTVNVDELDSWL